MTASYDDIVSDPEIGLVVECMGGVEPARTYITAALPRGQARRDPPTRAVVGRRTSPSFAAESAETGAGLYIEAAVGGGIPVDRERGRRPAGWTR